MAGVMLAAAVLLTTAGCVRGERAEPAAATSSVDSLFRDSSGREIGRAVVTQEAGGLRIRVAIDGIRAGSHGLHFHAIGRCDAPGFESAGPHWNPSMRLHGTRNPGGPHGGDLPNLLAGTDGRGTLEYLLPGARLRGGRRALLDGDGAALMVHASPDDYRTDPSGNSGARIACAVLS